MPEVVERSGEVAGLRTHWREAPAEGRPPILWVHGVPTASWDWIPYLERIGGVAPDLPGFGSSAKPADFDYSIKREAIQPGDIEKCLKPPVKARDLHTCVTLLPGYRWHWVARVWRTPVVGEL